MWAASRCKLSSRYLLQDGYTMETLDIYGHDEHGKDIVLIHNVGSPKCFTWFMLIFDY